MSVHDEPASEQPAEPAGPEPVEPTREMLWSPPASGAPPLPPPQPWMRREGPPPQFQPPRLPPPMPPPVPARDGVSIAGFVTGVLGIVVVAIPLAIAGLVRTRDGRRRGRGFAVAGLVIAVLWTALAAASVSALLSRSGAGTVAIAEVPTSSPTTPPVSPSVSAPPSHPSPRPATAPKRATPKVPPRLAYVDGLRTGQCLLTKKLGASVLKVPVVPCRQTHDAEVVGVGQLPGRWRGEAALNRVGDSTCEAMFRGYVGVDLDSSSHGYSWFGPTKDSWAQGDRLIVCMASDGGSPMTGSVKGSKS